MSSRRKKGKTKPPVVEPEVRAAGGLVWREVVLADERGETRDGVEIVLVHRPRYDDWSFPKGKLDKHETYEDAAVREVAEETGLVCELGRELPSTEYLDSKGRRKLVRYWAMRVVDVEPWTANDEVDLRRWVTVDEAAGMLSYAHDRALLDLLRDELR
jgi:8-oxo-dGTP pyrophosphatase MutT (NUDIX family)